MNCSSTPDSLRSDSNARLSRSPFSGQLVRVRESGEFACVVCGALIFDSASKYDSGCGWPAFSDVKHLRSIRLLPDLTSGTLRFLSFCLNPFSSIVCIYSLTVSF